MAFVVDASVALGWALEEEDHKLPAQALALLLASEAWAPSLWWFELRNALVINEQRGRLSEADTALFLNSVARLPVTLDRDPDGTTVLMLARRHRLTVYDASYLELALRLGLPLASLDGELRRAATACGVALLGETM
jgi:predicted nucleic acid-binding protein